MNSQPVPLNRHQSRAADIHDRAARLAKHGLNLDPHRPFNHIQTA
jgi:hypothetical protein